MGPITQRSIRLDAVLLLLTLMYASASGATREESLAEASTLQAEAQQLNAKGPYAAAIAGAQRALTIREEFLGPDHPDTADAVDLLGTSYAQSGAYKEAEPLLRRALAIREKALGPEHAKTA